MPTDDGRTYAFPVRGDVRFQDGSVLTAYDVAASWNYIVDPPEGVISVRRGYYSMIDRIEAPYLKTVVFRLKFATAAFLPALADPYAFIYKKEFLDRDPHWFEKNIMGSVRSVFRNIRPDSRFPECAIPITTDRDCPIWMASPEFSPTSRRCGWPRSKRPRGDRVSWFPAGDARRAGRRAR